MGGRGSGRPEAYGTQFCSSSLPIDIRDLARKRILSTGREFTCRWWTGDDTGGGNRIGGYVNRAEPRDTAPFSITLRYSESIGGNWRNREEEVRITYTACTKGGERPWFVCPVCGQRCAVVYYVERYQCRKCGNLKYKSQHECPADRMLRKALNIRNKYGQESGGIHAPFPSKPKGQHWHTYMRALTKAYALEDARWSWTCQRLGIEE